MTILWKPEALAAELGITLPAPRATPNKKTASSAGASAAVEAVDLDNYPWVKAALETVSSPPDRSTDTMRVVAACYDAGLTLAQARRAVSTRADLTERLAERDDDDVQTCWLKAIDKLQNQIVECDRNTRGGVLAALREIYDGRWVREVGTDGGRSIPWEGRIAVVGAVTTAWDTAHAVIASMGDRFVLVRIDSTTKRQAAGRQAISNTGEEPKMRAELAGAVAAVLAGMAPEPVNITEEETAVLLAAADLVTLTRTGVEYDYRGDVIDAHAPRDADPVRQATRPDRTRRCRYRDGSRRGAAAGYPLRPGFDAAATAGHHR